MWKAGCLEEEYGSGGSDKSRIKADQREWRPGYKCRESSPPLRELCPEVMALKRYGLKGGFLETRSITANLPILI